MYILLQLGKKAVKKFGKDTRKLEEGQHSGPKCTPSSTHSVLLENIPTW